MAHPFFWPAGLVDALCFLLLAVFWGDIALDEDDLKLFHIDKAEDWTKPSIEKAGHDTGKYWLPDLLVYKWDA